ncbi:MAG: hypothetical protein GC204_09980 [Chloroflexi bacterium]|nr:hypothetical protein [Chloroflexota bacterium]
MSEKVLHEIKIIETEDGFRIEMTGDKEQLRKLLFEHGSPFSVPFGRGRGFGRRGFGGRGFAEHGPFGQHNDHEAHEHGRQEHRHHGHPLHEHMRERLREHLRPPFEEQPTPEEMRNQHFFSRRFRGHGDWKAKRGGYDMGPWWDEGSTPDDVPPVQV